MATGRKKDIIWDSFVQKELTGASGKTGSRAECKKCKKELAGLVSRMKTHYNSCVLSATLNPQEASASALFHNADSDTNAKRKRYLPNPSLDNFVLKTSKNEKDMLDIQIARYVYATNTPFSSVDHPEFKQLITNLRPGYKPPNRHDLGGILLEKVHNSVMETYEKDLKGQTVSMALDGWSNVHNEPVVGVTVSTSKGETYLVDTIDTSGHPHNHEYLCLIASKSIKATEEKFGCKVRSLVTDNAANVAKMREELEKAYNEDHDGINIITYGCSAHIFNLLAKDIKIPNVKAHVVDVIKYFRNNHFASAKLREAGAKKLEMPSDVRWNSMMDALGSYITNWPMMVKVCEENREKIDKDIAKKVTDFVLKRNVEEYLRRLKPIANACDRAQRDNCTIGEVVEVWKKLSKKMSEVCAADNLDLATRRQVDKVVIDRYEMAMTPAHFLANIIDPRYRGQFLTIPETEMGMKYAADLCPDLVPIIINYKAKSTPFSVYMFDAIDRINRKKLEKEKALADAAAANQKLSVQELTELNNYVDVTALSWWLSLAISIDKHVMQVIEQLHIATASTAGLERIFSTFGFVHSKVRNRLGVPKAAKLVTVFKSLNKSELSD